MVDNRDERCIGPINAAVDAINRLWPDVLLEPKDEEIFRGIVAQAIAELARELGAAKDRFDNHQKDWELVASWAMGRTESIEGSIGTRAMIAINELQRIWQQEKATAAAQIGLLERKLYDEQLEAARLRSRLATGLG